MTVLGLALGLRSRATRPSPRRPSRYSINHVALGTAPWLGLAHRYTATVTATAAATARRAVLCAACVAPTTAISPLLLRIPLQVYFKDEPSVNGDVGWVRGSTEPSYIVTKTAHLSQHATLSLLLHGGCTTREMPPSCGAWPTCFVALCCIASPALSKHVCAQVSYVKDDVPPPKTCDSCTYRYEGMYSTHVYTTHTQVRYPHTVAHGPLSPAASPAPSRITVRRAPRMLLPSVCSCRPFFSLFCRRTSWRRGRRGSRPYLCTRPGRRCTSPWMHPRPTSRRTLRSKTTRAEFMYVCALARPSKQEHRMSFWF